MLTTILRFLPDKLALKNKNITVTFADFVIFEYVLLGDS